MNDRTIIVPAQAGLWLVMLSPGPAADEPWELVEQPLDRMGFEQRYI